MGCVACHSQFKKQKDLNFKGVPVLPPDESNIQKINENWLELEHNSILQRRCQTRKHSTLTVNDKSPLSKRIGSV